MHVQLHYFSPISKPFAGNQDTDEKLLTSSVLYNLTLTTISQYQTICTQFEI
jgi:hypothetical protein